MARRATRICVYCGSNHGSSPAYERAARRLGGLLAARDVELVYGGGRVGLMGAVADGALAAGGRAIGVIPQHLIDAEVAHEGLSELVVVGSMHERKARMIALADGFVALPGGLGTFEELFEVLTWNQLGLVRSPVVVLDVEDFYAPLRDLLGGAVASGFVRAEHADQVRFAQDPHTAVDAALRPVEHVEIPKWSGPGAPGTV